MSVFFNHVVHVHLMVNLQSWNLVESLILLPKFYHQNFNKIKWLSIKPQWRTPLVLMKETSVTLELEHKKVCCNSLKKLKLWAQFITTVQQGPISSSYFAAIRMSIRHLQKLHCCVSNDWKCLENVPTASAMNICTEISKYHFVSE